MITGYIYNSVTGELLRRVTCPEEYLALQMQEGESFIEGFADESTQYVLNGILVNR